MKIIQTLAFAALLAGSAVAASAETSTSHEHFMRNYSALAGASTLTAGPLAETSNSVVEEPAISPNGNPTLSDFAARR
jgi:hypothetical protein